MTTTATETYRAARDQLLGLRGEHERAVAEFTWPDLGDRFTWAHDWFDACARDDQGTALWIAEADGREARYSFAEMMRRSATSPTSVAPTTSSRPATTRSARSSWRAC